MLASRFRFGHFARAGLATGTTTDGGDLRGASSNSPRSGSDAPGFMMTQQDTPTDLLRDLIAAGLDPSLIARISLMVSRASEIDRRREMDAARQQKLRDKRHVSHANHVMSRDERDVTLVTDNKENQQLNGHDQLFIDSSLTSLDSERKKERKSRSQNRGQRLPDDWQPNAGHIAAGLKLGITEAQIQEHAQDMRIWAQTNGHRSVARKSDWDMTFLGWLRRTAKQPRRFAPMERQLPR